MTDRAPLTDEELAAIEEGYRGTAEQRADKCESCPKGWPLLRVEPQPYGIIHVHLAPWDDGHEDRDPYVDFVWCDDPRPDVRRLIADLRTARERIKELEAEVAEDNEIIEIAKNHCGCIPSLG